MIIPGCTTPAQVEETEQEDELQIPERLNIVADTAGRDVDRLERMDVLLDANGENTLNIKTALGQGTYVVAMTIGNASTSKAIRRQ